MIREPWVVLSFKKMPLFCFDFSQTVDNFKSLTLFCRHIRKEFIRYVVNQRKKSTFRDKYANRITSFANNLSSDTMHTVLTRGNAILAYTLSVLACLTFCCFISTVFLDYRTNVKINTVKTLVKNVPNYGASKELHDLGFITFDLTVCWQLSDKNRRAVTIFVCRPTWLDYSTGTLNNCSCTSPLSTRLKPMS